MGKVTAKEEFHCVDIKYRGKHRGYDIYMNNEPFLVMFAPTRKLSRSEARAIVNLMNALRG